MLCASGLCSALLVRTLLGTAAELMGDCDGAAAAGVAGAASAGSSSATELRGIALGTAAQFLVSLGLCGMKWAHKRNAALPPSARSPKFVVLAFLVNAVGGLLSQPRSNLHPPIP